ncbi:hypothetical protein [Natronobacterium gregoryi]|uniref:Uncharacterized protein n=2 Tax=Natronobacterium gregoryi TaxID=44930 RepID=L0AEG6_NATGS|nr:hypothetical protein [Natronobacterium gregoryi]AFZ71824.1 hypothetical protein Natgr_0574 [Natronobacterium gregoryi SP2]ELY73002.1 hypothetical protein C490_02156 [Natronobacterium gregoryi SP2]PLK19143.1 hypothetical protein CYV19_16550 [Natronobacterium gregoryi SP2]SFJ60578.1 hypothetical protein SAMN05443661_14522 [Natronobacterium gregoryi]
MTFDQLSGRQRRWSKREFVLVISGWLIVSSLLTGRLIDLERILDVGVIILFALPFFSWPLLSRYNKVVGCTILSVGLGVIWISIDGIEARPSRNLGFGYLFAMYGAVLFARPALLCPSDDHEDEN